MFEDITKLEPDWWAEALCITEEIETFFGSDGAHTSLTEARKHCSVCPAVKDCLEHALTIPEEYGIWAGTSARNRESMLEDINSGEFDIHTVIATVISNSFRWRRKK